MKKKLIWINTEINEVENKNGRKTNNSKVGSFIKYITIF